MSKDHKDHEGHRVGGRKTDAHPKDKSWNPGRDNSEPKGGKLPKDVEGHKLGKRGK